MGKRFAFTHNNMESLEKQLKNATNTLGPEGSILVITEGVFGMSGDQGKLKEIVELKKKYNFRLFIDDAHGFGVMGPQGQGTHFEQGVPDGVDIYFATFAKAMASIGAFVSSKKEIILFLRYEMRSQTFAKAMPMPFVVGNLKRLELIQKHPEFKVKLWTIVNAMQKGLKERGFNIGATNTCVTPVYLKGTTQEAANLIMDLRENFGVFCSMVIYPVIPKGEILIRIVPSADNTMEDVEITLNAFTEIAKRLKEKKYDSQIVNTPKL
jgi:glycine C-acetyltransferase